MFDIVTSQYLYFYAFTHWFYGRKRCDGFLHIDIITNQSQHRIEQTQGSMLNYDQSESNQGTPCESKQTTGICEICNGGNSEINCVVSSLLESLREVVPNQQNESNAYDCGGFTKLLRLIFYSKFRNSRDTKNCPHLKVQKLFLDSLKIDVVNLNRISNKKINQLAKYNFHADTVSQQVKSFHRHFATVSSHENKKIVKKCKRKIVSPAQTIGSVLTEKKNEKQQQPACSPKQDQKLQDCKQPLVKVEADYPITSAFRSGTQFYEYHPHAMNGPYPYHSPVPYNNGDYEQMVNNFMMINYRFNPQP